MWEQYDSSVAAISRIVKKLFNYFLGCLPSLLVWGLVIYLFSRFSFLTYFAIAFVVLFFTYIYIGNWRLNRSFSTGKNLPKKFLEHPIQETSEFDYRAARQKMEEFILSVEENQPARVEVTSDEINSLYLQGTTPSRTLAYLPRYYEISEGVILEHNLQYNPFNWSGFTTYIKKIEFSEVDGIVSVSDGTFSKNGKLVPPQYSKSYFVSIDKIISGSHVSGRGFLEILLKLDKTLDWADSMKLVASRMKSIEIEGSKLVLTA